MSSASNQILNMMVLPGEPKDGTGRICTHLWMNNPKGKFLQHYVMQPIADKNGEVVPNEFHFAPTKGQIACNPNLNPMPVVSGRDRVSGKTIITITSMSDDPRAINCPKCMATEYYQTQMKLQEGG